MAWLDLWKGYCEQQVAVMHDLVLRNGNIVTPNGIVLGDIAISDGRFSDIGVVTGNGSQEIDANGRWVMPGGVDVHAHIEQMSGMGVMNADTFETATKSALIGGTTSVISFAAQAKGQTLKDAVSDYQARAQRGAMTDHAFHIIVSDTTVPSFKHELKQLIEDGHRSLKLFTTYNIRLDDAQILHIMSMAHEAGALVCVHAENDAVIERERERLIRLGRTRPIDHAASRPRIAEIEAVSRICQFAQYLDQPVMLFHISTREAAEVVARAQASGAPVWAETCPHYLFMTEEVLKRPDGGKWMCSPPQRDLEDQQALWSALLDGDLQIVSSDHAPYRYDETGKLSAGPDAGFHQIANGLPGLETRLPLMFDAMVSKGRGGPERFAQLTSTEPARLHGLSRKGSIAPGLDADLVIWDAERRVTYGANDLHDNVGYNPWEGVEITGYPETVMLRGKILVDQGKFYAEPGCGRWQKRDGFLHSLKDKR